MVTHSSPDASPHSRSSYPELGSSFSAMADNSIVCHCVAVGSGHNTAVSSIVSAGDYLYSASQGKELCLWEQPDLLLCDRFGADNSDSMCSVKALLAIGDTVFGAYQDHKIRAWRRSSNGTGKPTHKQIATLPCRTDCFLKSLSQKNYVQVRRHHKKLWIEHTDTISALAVGKTVHAEAVLYSSSWDKTVKVWRLSDLKCVESIQAHDDAVNALAFSDTDNFLYTGSADGKVKVWRKGPRAKKHALMATLEGGHEKGASVNALALGGAGDLLFSGGSDGGVAVWGRKKGEKHVSVLLYKAAACHALPILSLCTVDEQLLAEEGQGSLLLTGSADKTVKVWRVSAAKEGKLSCEGVLQGHQGPVKAICVAPNKGQQAMIVGGGCLVYTGSSDKSIRAWWVSRHNASRCP